MRFWLLAAVAALGCGGSSSSSNNNQTCSVTVSGAPSGDASGKYACSVTAANSNGTSAVSVTVATVSGLDLGVGWSGAFATGTYKNTDANAMSGLTYDDAANNSWTASAYGGSTIDGSYSLSLTSTGDGATGTYQGHTGTIYPSAHGTLSATLAPGAGNAASAMGSITVQATF